MTETNQNAKLEEEPMATSEEAEAAETAAEEESATKADAEEQKQNAEATPAEEGGDEKKETDPKTEEKAFMEARDQARRATISDFLTVYDYFSMGMAAIETAADVAVLKQGMEMIWAEFQRVLEGLNVKEVESVGKPFDANIHEAMSQEASDTVPEGVVIRQWKAGFKIGDKLLRPAMVVVSTGKPSEPEPEPAKEPEGEEGQKIHVNVEDEETTEASGSEKDTVSES